ncbi:hypothetical protein CCUS01_10137, partial [Colletotrichum cuscutae]
ITDENSLARFTNCQTRKDCETLDKSQGLTQERVDEDKLQCHASIRPRIHCIFAHAPSCHQRGLVEGWEAPATFDGRHHQRNRCGERCEPRPHRCSQSLSSGR